MANWRSGPKGDISENSCSNFQSSKEEGCFVSKQLTGSNKKFSKDDTLEQVESDKRKGLDKANSQGGHLKWCIHIYKWLSSNWIHSLANKHCS